MAAKEVQVDSGHSLLGNKDHLGSEAKVKKWEAPTLAQVDKMPALPESAERGWDTEELVTDADVEQEQLPEGVAESSTHAFVFRHACQAAAVLRTILRGEEVGADGPLAGMTARQMVAAFLRTLGERIGSRVIGHLDPDEQVATVQGIAHDAETTRQTDMHVLEQVRQRIVSGDYIDRGERGFATRLLKRAMSDGQARNIVDRALGVEEPVADPFPGFTAEVLALFVCHEHPQTIALILGQLDSTRAAEVISRLPEAIQGDVAYRMATSEVVSPGAVERALEGFEHGLRCSDGPFAGPRTQHEKATARSRRLKAVADILNRCSSSSEGTVLNHLDSQDPELADEVRNLMFTFGDIVMMTDRDIQVLLREIEQKDLVVALKAAEEEFKEKLLRNLSEQVRNEIREEMEFIGPMRLADVDEVQLRIVQQVRQLEEQGKVTIVRGDSDEQFV